MESGDVRIDGYATAVLEIAKAEGELDRVGDELNRIAQAFDSSEPLRDAMTDPRIPVDRKQGIVDELLGGRASKLSVSLVNFVVSQGRARDLSAIAAGVVAKAAHERSKEVAYVRSAIELDDETVRRLEEKLSAATGQSVEARVTVDPSVLGGLVVTVGDEVFDGSVRSRFRDLREAWS
ncbi:MAG: ATP synthase F1 subunit delta [Acidimicrobiia bacterium]|nr:ATP synthase F1 subunit delta [Acidimicrobiia bacterium]NNC75565.1 ATP synthase F1 subunit delta [Acidimicrobiia bacterium]